MRQFIKAVGPLLSFVFAAAGLVALSVEIFLDHPTMVRFSTDGRTVVGHVVRSAPREAANGSRYVRNHSFVEVEDPQLGQQTIEVYGDLPFGQTVPVLCVTSEGRCLAADKVRASRRMWPFTPLMISGEALLLLALALMATSRFLGGKAPGQRTRVPAIQKH